MLLSIELLDQFILTFPKKVCLFAYKSYNIAHQPMIAQRGKNNVERNMQAMFTTPSSISGQVVTENIIMDNRFIFVQNRYPAIYKW
jgi:hypothetical protein